jgi:hypothetical protein
VFVAVAVAIAVLFVLARMSIAGIGPFPAHIDSVATSGTGLAVTLTVTNDGASGQTTCRVGIPGDPGVGTAAFVTTPRIESHQTRTFTAVVSAFGAEPRDLDVTCRTP